MSISFACDSCGKAFTVDDKFAGKKGKCKQCGATMQIPGGVPSRAAPVSRAVDREISPSRRAPGLASAPKADVFGFDDEPLPPRSSAPSSRESEVDAPPIPRPKKKKSAGFFGGSKGKSSSSSSSGGNAAVTIIVRVVLGIFGGIGGLVGLALGLPGLRSVLVPGWASHSDIESFIKRQVDMTNELTVILRTVTDVPSATSASPRANGTIKKLEQNLRSNKDRKGNQKDIDAIKQKYANDQRLAVQDFTREVMRVAMIPGAMDALAIQQALMELGAVEQSIPGANAQSGFTPPPMPTAMPIPRPNFNMPPNTRPPGMPGPMNGPSRPNFPGPRRGRVPNLGMPQ